MPRIHMTLRHTLGATEALARMRQFVARLAVQYVRHISHAEQHWEGNVGRFKLHLMGFAVAAVVTVGETDVRMEGTMPWAAALFRGRIEETIRREVAALLK